MRCWAWHHRCLGSFTSLAATRSPVPAAAVCSGTGSPQHASISRTTPRLCIQPSRPRAQRNPRGEHALARAAGDSNDAAAGASPRPAAIVLGIESSCDDTGAAVVTSDGRVLGEALATQADIHAPWGGVVPNLARDAHAAAIDRTVDAALAAAGLQPHQLTAVAVTVGPGLSLCLRVGAQKARQLARCYNLPLVSVHHMEAHALVARLPAAAGAAAPAPVSTTPPAAAATAADAAHQATGSAGADANGGSAAPAAASSPSNNTAEARAQPGAGTSTSGRPRSAGSSWGKEATGPTGAAASVDAGTVLSDVARCAALPFPFLCLLVSGGHNLLVLVQGVGRYVQLGTTMDDAIGEAYDKVARLLGLEMKPHGGAALEALAREGNTAAFKFAVPMRKYATCDFSFAGLKTSSRMAIEQALRPEVLQAMSQQQAHQARADIAASFQHVAVTHLMEKTQRGVTWARELAPDVRHLVVAGGVACNKVIRARLQELAAKEGLELVLPPPRWCTDNGVMVAWAGIERLAQGWAEAVPPLLPPETTPAPPGAPSAASSLASADDDGSAATRSPEDEEWIELKPRWPLTRERHPRCAAADQELRSAKKVRIHAPLSDMARPATAPAMATAAAAAAPTSGMSGAPACS